MAVLAHQGGFGQHDFASLEAYALKKGDAAKNVSGRQEMIENILNRYL